MAQVFVDDVRRKAGADYLSALDRLGLDPEGLLWAWDKTDERFVLVVVSSFFDAAGPLKLSQWLFRAYRAGLMPAGIDPLALRLHSPEQSWVRALMAFIDGEATSAYDDDLVMIHMRDIYRLVRPQHDIADRRKDWRLIERNVEQPAA